MIIDISLLFFILAGKAPTGMGLAFSGPAEVQGKGFIRLWSLCLQEGPGSNAFSSLRPVTNFFKELLCQELLLYSKDSLPWGDAGASLPACLLQNDFADSVSAWDHYIMTSRLEISESSKWLETGLHSMWKLDCIWKMEIIIFISMMQSFGPSPQGRWFV